MAISGTYFVKMWIPNPTLIHGTPSDEPAGVGRPPSGAPEEKPNLSIPLKDYGTPPENFFEGEMTFHFVPNADGTLCGDAGGTPINSGYYTGNEYFKVDFNAGPGRWEIIAKVDDEGYIEGLISVGGGKVFPNFVYGKKIS